MLAPEEGLGLTPSKFPNKLSVFCPAFDTNQANPTVMNLTNVYQIGVNSGVSKFDVTAHFRHSKTGDSHRTFHPVFLVLIICTVEQKVQKMRLISFNAPERFGLLRSWLPEHLPRLIGAQER